MVITHPSPFGTLGWRPRTWAAILAVRWAWYGWAFWTQADRLRAGSDSFRYVEALRPLEWWAAAMMAGGAALAVLVVFSSARALRWATAIAAVVGATVGVLILFAGTTSPAAASFTTEAAISFLVTSMVFTRSPGATQ